MKKTLAMILAVFMILSVTAVAFGESASSLNEGRAGAWTEKDTEIIQQQMIVIKKDLVSYNASSTEVFAPAFAYEYTVTPASVSGLSVTDDADVHGSGTAVQAPVKAGITSGLVVNDGEAGASDSAVGKLVFTNSMKLNSSASGATNSYDIKIDFSGVSFSQPGVYRYKIAEALADGATYKGIAVEHGNSENPNERYLDVYVDGNLKIYGYVCMAANDNVDTSTDKTNGFVAESGGQDSYYTYDLKLSKNVVGDTFGEGHAFPFTVTFRNSEEFKTTFAITENVESGSSGFDPEASEPTWSGVVAVKEGMPITYTGIPAGVDVDVYETNDMVGVTYMVVTSVNGVDAGTDNNVSWGDAPSAAVPQNEKEAYQSTKQSVDTEVYSKLASRQSIDIINTLLLISPTGVVMRVAPYVLILAAGLALLLIGHRRKMNASK